MIKIIKPKLDIRTFNGGTLNNGVKYIFINDSNLQTSYVSIAVNIGYHADTIPGLAHFLEHMLFMGSHKYPEVHYFFDKLNELNGHSNAYTSDLNTVYYFSIFNDGLNEIFDIFSRFFIDPLFKKESIDKEINAVNNEHLKNINNDYWIIDYFLNYILNKNSNINKFGTGNTETLKINNIRELLIDFYNKYYIPDNISICILSSISIDKLYKIINNTFGNIKKTKNINKYIIKKPFYNDNILKTYHIQSISNIYNLIFIWEIPILDNYNIINHFNILNYILLNNSKDSLYFVLNNYGLIHDINIEIKYEGVFILTFILTNKGYNNINKIESIFFSYLNYIYTFNINNYAKYIKKLYNFNFNYSNKINSNNDLTNYLVCEHFYNKTKYVRKKLFKIINNDNIFNNYINKNNYIKILVSNEKIPKHNYIKLEYYENSYYTILETMPIKIITNKIDKLDIKYHNFLDSHIKIINNLDYSKVPILINRNEWYGGYSKFNEPIIYICMQLNNNNYVNTCYNYLLTLISCDIINYILSIIFYKEFELSYHINFNINTNLSSIFININSLNDIDKLKLLINKLYKFIINISKYLDLITEHFIENLLITYINSCNNIKYSNPYDYLLYITNLIILPNQYPKSEILKNLNKININTIKKYIINNLFDKSSLTTFTYGNTKIIDNLFIDFYKLFNYSNYNYPINNKLAKDIIIKHPNKKETSICCAYFYYIGNFIPKEYILMELTVNILSQEFFNKLRTNKQLGYLVKMIINKYNNEYYIVQIIQSNKNLEYVKSEINKFNKNILNIINNINFENYINQLIKEISEPCYNLYDLYNIYNNQIMLRTYLFYTTEILLKTINKIVFKDLIIFIKKYLNNNNKIEVIIN
jgi:insulysin